MSATRIVAIVAVFCFAGCCPHCLTIPTHDSTPPTAGMTIGYYDNHVSKTKMFSEQDPDVSIVADDNQKILVIFTAGDPEGMRILQPELTIATNHGVGQIQNAEIQPTSVTCPMEILTDKMEFPAGGGARSIRLSIKGTNWAGLVTLTHQLTIVVQ